MKPKLLVIGHARHGKDTVCEILRDVYDFKFQSSSSFCSQKFIFDELKDKYDYQSEEECYADRANHREEWYNLICSYNETDPAKLGREIFKENDIYCGLRNAAEFYAMLDEGTFDCAVWVDRSGHLPPEDASSMTLDDTMADYIIDNNGSLDDLKIQVDKLILKIGS